MTGCFVGRERELGILEEVYNQTSLRTCSVLGRRRVGKSCLLNRFCEDKRSFFVQFVEGSSSDNLDILAMAIDKLKGSSGTRFGTILDAMEALAEEVAKERTVIVFDEFPNLVSSIPDSPSVIQRFIDRQLSATDSMMVVCGSQTSVMRNETEDPSRPLFGRFSRIIEVVPMTFRECAAFHPGMSDTDMLRLYLTLGGIPLFHIIADRKTFRGCVERLFLERSPILGDEGEDIIRRVMRPHTGHLAVVSAVASGAVVLKDISERTGIKESTCKKYLDELMENGVLGTLNPMNGATKRPTYRIEDNLVAFHFTVLRRNLSAIGGMDPGSVFDALEQDIDDFLGLRFESFCAEFVRTNYVCTEIGKWWGRSNGENRDIDVTARVKCGNGKADLFVECGFRNRKAGFGTLETLKYTVEGLRLSLNERFMIISPSGFEENLLDFAEDNGVVLVGMDELIGRRAPKRL